MMANSENEAQLHHQIRQLVHERDVLNDRLRALTAGRGGRGGGGGVSGGRGGASGGRGSRANNDAFSRGKMVRQGYFDSTHVNNAGAEQHSTATLPMKRQRDGPPLASQSYSFEGPEFEVEKRPKMESDEQLQSRNRRMLNVGLLGHLHRAKEQLQKEEKTQQAQMHKLQEQRVEEKLNFGRKNLSEMRKRDFEEQRSADVRRVGEVQDQLAAMEGELLRMHLTKHYQSMKNFFSTTAQPMVFWLPAILDEKTIKLRKNAEAVIDEKLGWIHEENFNLRRSAYEGKPYEIEVTPSSSSQIVNKDVSATVDSRGEYEREATLDSNANEDMNKESHSNDEDDESHPSSPALRRFPPIVQKNRHSSERDQSEKETRSNAEDNGEILDYEEDEDASSQIPLKTSIISRISPDIAREEEEEQDNSFQWSNKEELKSNKMMPTAEDESLSTSSTLRADYSLHSQKEGGIASVAEDEIFPLPAEANEAAEEIPSIHIEHERDDQEQAISSRVSKSSASAIEEKPQSEAKSSRKSEAQTEAVAHSTLSKSANLQASQPVSSSYDEEDAERSLSSVSSAKVSSSPRVILKEAEEDSARHGNDKGREDGSLHTQDERENVTIHTQDEEEREDITLHGDVPAIRQAETKFSLEEENRSSSALEGGKSIEICKEEMKRRKTSKPDELEEVDELNVGAQQKEEVLKESVGEILKSSVSSSGRDSIEKSSNKRSHKVEAGPAEGGSDDETSAQVEDLNTKAKTRKNEASPLNKRASHSGSTAMESYTVRDEAKASSSPLAHYERTSPKSNKSTPQYSKSPPSMPEIEAMTVNSLTAVLKHYGLSTRGHKADLKKRLLEHLEYETPA